MSRTAPGDLVKRLGGRYSSALGIDLASADAGERFKWFLAAMLYGTRISESLATRTWREFAARDVLMRHLWTADGQPAAGFADFESALVREGLRLRRQRASA